MGNWASKRLDAEACVESVRQRVGAALNLVRGLADTATLDFSGLANATEEVKSGLRAAIQLVTGNPEKYPWFSFAVAQAQQGTLLASAGDVYAWYFVTHKDPPCAGKGRNTTSSNAKRMAYNLGFLLGQPEIRSRNNLTEQSLRQFNADLNDQGMDGLSPLMPKLLAGFNAVTEVLQTDGGGNIISSQFIISPASVRNVVKNAQKTSTAGTGAGLIAAILALLFFA